jgi:mono/diheme cytochrome c family protein
MPSRQPHEIRTRAGLFTALLLTAWIAAPPLLGGQEFPADIHRGKAVYERHCQRCHGTGGWGDGPDAGSLTVPPANFHLFRSYLKSDDELQRVIEHGVVFSPMHAWQGQLTENEIQDVLAYIRLLSQQGR